jgi:hypothetical protein
MRIPDKIICTMAGLGLVAAGCTAVDWNNVDIKVSPVVADGPAEKEWPDALPETGVNSESLISLTKIEKVDNSELNRLVDEIEFVFDEIYPNRNRASYCRDVYPINSYVLKKLSDFQSSGSGNANGTASGRMPFAITSELSDVVGLPEGVYWKGGVEHWGNGDAWLLAHEFTHLWYGYPAEEVAVEMGYKLTGSDSPYSASKAVDRYLKTGTIKGGDYESDLIVFDSVELNN